MAACNLAADRAYYTAVKLKAMYKFEDYATSYQKVASDWDTGRITDRQASLRADRSLGRFYSLCNCNPAQDKFGRVPGPETYQPEQGFFFNPGPPASSPFR